MATIKYKCNNCKRETELLEKPSSMTTFSKCIITYGCKGTLSVISRNQDNTRESLPEPVVGLDDYTPREIFYLHKQNLINKVWKINHKLGSAPTVKPFVYMERNLVHLPNDQYTVEIVDNNNLKVILNTPYSGTAHCVSRSSVKNYKLNETVYNSTFKVTFGGTFVFAFPKIITKDLISPSELPYPTVPYTVDEYVRPVRLEVSIKEPNKEELICIEDISNSVVRLTPWNGWTDILVRKRRLYDIKYKNILDFTRTFQLDDITPSDIETGTEIRFLRVDYGNGVLVPIEEGSVIVLLANTPYASIDKIKDKILDVSNVNFTKSACFTYKDGEVYIDEKLIEKTYPSIIRVNQ